MHLLMPAPRPMVRPFTFVETERFKSKSQFATLKAITLLKLELMTSAMATRLIQFVISSLHLQPSDPLNHKWTDNQIAPHRTYKQHSSNPFISHHVMEIFGAFPMNNCSLTP